MSCQSLHPKKKNQNQNIVNTMTLVEMSKQQFQVMRDDE